MMETEITCTCRRIALPDLGLVLQEGTVAYVDSKAAAKSKDLRLAQRAGGVHLREVTRVRERRPAPSTSRLPRPTGPTHPTSRPGTSATPLAVQAEVDMGGIRRVVREEVTGAIKEALLQGMPVSIGYRVVADPDSGEQVAVPDPAMTFIPSGIVKSDAKADIAVEASTTGGEGVDEAVKALKASGRKKSTGKRKRKKESE